ncbi:unnamed protein product [Rhizoctonia solani]|uniref:Uncharacterized protein n=1 Tax=Rhizoctonia solani TaxID=456999 RepID=A0A8H3H348_9AGAM|nr:unnamed protein product [Rhizoctonia solani]
MYPGLKNINQGRPLPSQPLPESKYESQISMNRVFRSDFGELIRGSSFQENREHFIRLFDEKIWNYPDEALPPLESELHQRRALVIAIHYGGGDPLPATYVDALNIIHILGRLGLRIYFI